MEQNLFQKLLLETVICSIACDGDIDDREIAELHKMVNHTQYFNGIDSLDLLNNMIQAVKTNGRVFVGEYFNRLKKIELSPAQELQVLEVILRIIQADGRLDDNEVTFLKLVRSNFGVHDEIIQQRFGDIPYLIGITSKNIISTSSLDKVKALADKIDHIAVKEKGFDGFFESFLGSSSDLELEEGAKNLPPQ